MGSWVGQDCIYVSDLERTIAFYETLGLVCASRTDIPHVKEAIVENPEKGGGKIQLAQKLDSDDPIDMGNAFWKLYINTDDCHGLHDIDSAVDEIHATHELGLRGVMIPTRWFDAPAYHDLRYEPVWAACEELAMPVHTHSGAGPADYGDGPGMLAIYTTEAYWLAARPLWVLLWSGVFERHPGLRYVCAENGAWWAPDILHKSDEKWVGGHNTAKFGNLFREHLKMRPSDYFRRNCSLAAPTPGVGDIARRHDVGVGNLLWGNDLPHPEGTIPHTRKWIRERFHEVPVGETRRILGENAADLYGLDRDALTPIAERIGPTLEEVHGAGVGG